MRRARHTGQCRPWPGRRYGNLLQLTTNAQYSGASERCLFPALAGAVSGRRPWMTTRLLNVTTLTLAQATEQVGALFAPRQPARRPLRRGIWLSGPWALAPVLVCAVASKAEIMTSSVDTGKTRVLLSWSSGKDSAWTLYQLQQDPTVEVVGLLTTFNAVSLTARPFTACASSLLRLQADSRRSDR